jgi:hypothetical protein
MRLDDEIDALTETQHGCVAVWQLRDLGARSMEIWRLRGSSRWRETSQRVLIRAGSAQTPEQRACAAVLEAGRTGALIPASAAALWNLGASYRLLPAYVMADDTKRSFAGEVGRIYPRVGIPDRWITIYRGIRVVRPELCIYMLCGLVHIAKAERALDTGLSMGLVTVRSMRSCLADLRRRGRNGTSILEQLLEVRPLDYVAPTTGLEARFIEVIGGDWRRQIDSGGELWAGRVDFRHRVRPVIIEVQSERYHGALSFRRDDAARRAKLEAAGFVVAEVWDRQLWHAPWEARAIVESVLARATDVA